MAPLLLPYALDLSPAFTKHAATSTGLSPVRPAKQTPGAPPGCCPA